jgi:hypothetical protein
MNSRPISSYEDLRKEKERLTELLKAQKIQIHRDVDEIKIELRPMLTLSENVSKLFNREDGKDPIVAAGTNIGIDILASKLLSKSNFVVRLILPSILKNISSYLLPKAVLNSRKPPMKKPVEGKTVVRERTPLR